MNDNSPSQYQDHQKHVEGEDQFLKLLSDLWIPHRRRDLEIRYELGTLLNDKLKLPTVRQNYGTGTIKRISKELHIDKSDISRMRRFANQYESFEAFQMAEPKVHCWTQVRNLIVKSKDSKTSTDARASWSTTRSLNSLIDRFRSDHQLEGPQADEIRRALCELFKLAKAKLNIDHE